MLVSPPVLPVAARSVIRSWAASARSVVQADSSPEAVLSAVPNDMEIASTPERLETA